MEVVFWRKAGVCVGVCLVGGLWIGGEVKNGWDREFEDGEVGLRFAGVDAACGGDLLWRSEHAWIS